MFKILTLLFFFFFWYVSFTMIHITPSKYHRQNFFIFFFIFLTILLYVIILMARFLLFDHFIHITKLSFFFLHNLTQGYLFYIFFHGSQQYIYRFFVILLVIIIFIILMTHSIFIKILQVVYYSVQRTQKLGIVFCVIFRQIIIITRCQIKNMSCSVTIELKIQNKYEYINEIKIIIL